MSGERQRAAREDACLLELLLQLQLLRGDELLVEQHASVAAEDELAHLAPQALDVLLRVLAGVAQEYAADLQRAGIDLCERTSE